MMVLLFAARRERGVVSVVELAGSVCEMEFMVIVVLVVLAGK